MAFEPRFTIMNTITAALTEIERARGFLEAATLTDEWVDAMRASAFLLEAHHTTHIEGTQLLLKDATYILSTFPIVQRQDQAAYGSFRTRDLILAYMSALDAGDTETVVDR